MTMADGSNTSGGRNWEKMIEIKEGLTKISIAGKASNAHLPKSSFTPTPTPIENRLVKILDVKTIGSEVIDLLRPQIQSLTSLSPGDYHAKLDELILAANKLQDKESRQQIKKLYADASQILSAEVSRNDLLDEFRMMLLQG